MYLTRTLHNFIQTAGQQFPAILVTGPRQVGKTTFLQHLVAKDRKYITLDDPMVKSLAKEDPALFLQKFQPPLLIDEIQYAPEILPYIKMVIDSTKKSNLFWLTGSQQFHLMQNVSESLAGRIAIVQLLGLSKMELMKQAVFAIPFLPISEVINERNKHNKDLTLQELYQIIWRGSFPVIAINSTIDRDLFYSSYLQTYIQRDIRDLANVGDELAFMRFLRAVAARTSQMLNITELARDVSISPNTAKSWLSILITSGIVYLLEPYSNNVTQRLVKTPKMYMLDTGLCAYLTAWSSPETLEAGAMSGAILETWIFGELLKSYWHNGLIAPFFYYRDKDQKEIDLLILKDGMIYPIEFKKTASPNKYDIKHFRVLENLKVPVGAGALICLTKQILPLSSSVQAIPVKVC